MLSTDIAITKRALQKIATKFNINSPQEWKKITHNELKTEGLSYLLKDSKNSLFVALSSCFPEIEWKKEWFKLNNKEHKHWLNISNRRLFFEKVAKELNIKEPKDWRNVSLKYLRSCGGSGLLFRYGNSIYRSLKATFPEIEWKLGWFRNRGFWQNEMNQRNFFDELGKKVGVKEPKDWGKITWRLVTQYGGSSILWQYGSSVQRALQKLYPKIAWKPEWFVHVSPMKRASYWTSIENQSNFLYQIAEQYKIENMNDWKRVSYSLIHKKGGKGLITAYNNSLQLAINAVFVQNSNSLNEGMFSYGEKKTVKYLLSFV